MKTWYKNYGYREQLGEYIEYGRKMLTSISRDR